MKKTRIILYVLLSVAAVAACFFVLASKSGNLSSVTYISDVGYSLSMNVEDEEISVIYDSDGHSPVTTQTDEGCYYNIQTILEEYDFNSWCNLSDEDSLSDDYESLIVRYKNGKSYFFSSSLDLPGNASEIFDVINSCLMEYAGIIK